MSQPSSFKTPADYFKSQSPVVRDKLNELRHCILEAAPHAVELINYNILAYALVPGGKRDQQIMIAGFAKHVGLYPHPVTMEKFDGELSGYKKGKGRSSFHWINPSPKI